MNSPLASVLIGCVKIYRLTLSPWVGQSCRFVPTCSVYAQEALSAHGAFRGSWLALGRLLRCNPWGGSGFDPAPARPEPAGRHRDDCCSDASGGDAHAMR